MKWFSRVFRLSVALSIALSSYAMAADEVITFETELQRQRYQDLTFQLRCPKCQNQNVADSNAPISKDIREKTYEMILDGYKDQEIIDFMIKRYTEFVIYKPQMSRVTIWLWVLPVLILMGGLVILVLRTRNTNDSRPAELTEAERDRLDALLEEKSE